MTIYSYHETETTKFNFLPEGETGTVPLGEIGGRYYMAFDGEIPDQPEELDFRTHDTDDPVLAQLRMIQMLDGTPLEQEIVLMEVGLSDLEGVKREASLELKAHIRGLRAQIVGTDDPVKLAEYADKASLADFVLSGSASEAELETVRDEAKDFGLDTAEAMATVWRDKANELRKARNRVNRAERKALTDISAASTVAAVQEVLDSGKGSSQ